jgi:hypothetical protein
MTGVPDSEIDAAIDDRIRPVNELRSDAQRWSEAEATQLAHATMSTFEKQQLITELVKLEQRPKRFRRRRACPRCRQQICPQSRVPPLVACQHERCWSPPGAARPAERSGKARGGDAPSGLGKQPVGSLTHED